MVKIRLMRTGAKRSPHYRMVVIDSRSRRSGHYIEQIGHYHPQNEGDERLTIDADRAKHWLDNGAQPTERTAKLLKEVGVELPAKLLIKRSAGFQKPTEASA